MVSSDKNVGVLLVGGDPDELKSLGKELHQIENIYCKFASDIEEASLYVAEREFAVAIIPSGISTSGDLSVVQDLRRSGANKNIAIIFIASAPVAEDLLSSCLNAGTVDYLFRPYSFALLLNKIRLFLSFYEKSNVFDDEKKMYLDEKEHSRSIFNRMPIGYVNYLPINNGEDFELIDINPAAEKITGLNAKEVLGKAISKFYPESIKMGLLDVFKRVLDTGIADSTQDRLYDKNGSRQWFRDYIYRLPSGELVVLFSDVTETVKVQQELEKSEERFRTALEIVNDGIWDWNFESGEVYFSPRYFSMLGYDGNGLTSWSDVLRELVHPEDAPLMNREIEQKLKKGKPYSLEIRMRHKNGEWRWVLSRGRASEFNSQGSPVRAMGTHVDITELKQAAIQLRENESNLALAQRIANMGSWELARGAEHMVWSDQVFHLFGYIPGEIEPTVDFLRSLILPEDRKVVDNILSCSFLSDQSNRDEFRIRRADGVIRTLLSVVSAEKKADDSSEIFHGVFLDITNRKEAENRYIEQQTILDSILTGIKAAFLIVDPDTMEILDTNEQAESLFGLEREKILKIRCPKLLSYKLCDSNDDGENSSIYDSDSFLNREVTLQLDDEAIVPVSLSRIELVKDGSYCFALIMFDITEKKSLERQLAFAQKLEAVGQLASGIAHEINTPIQYIGGNLSYMESSFEKMKILIERANALVEEFDKRDEKLNSIDFFKNALEDVNSEFLAEEFPLAVKDSLEGVEQVAAIVLAMKRFSHPDVEDKKAVNINESIKNVVIVAKNEWKYSSDLEMHLLENLPLVMCYPGEINQALLNVLVNAAQANSEKMESTGKMGKIDISTAIKDGFVEISIADTGSGINEKNADKVFDPFFTTKEVGKGTGQGLAITYAIMEKHGGSIDFESEPGEGTLFKLRIPADETI